MKIVRTILGEWLQAHGYDGLTTDECGCKLSDLVPCDSNFSQCLPGHLAPCECGEGHPFHIVPDAVQEPAKL